MKLKNILSGKLVKIAVLVILVGLFLTACLTKAEKASNEGIRKSQKGLYGEAIEEFNRSIELDPNNPRPYRGRGYVYVKLAMYEEAIADYTKALELEPDFPGAYYNIGNLYRDIDENESAISNYTKAIELDPTNTNYLHNRGLLLGEMGRLDESITDLREACRLGEKDSCIALERAVKKKKNNK
jgi:tetratricopeptide (TPR) repeat protein